MPFKALSNREKKEKDSFLLNSHKTKRSQSALEYMMTYGWAILIIVIVAVILYSMGIFNPSSSITFTSSGFSPFTVSSSLCNNIGYKIAVLAGPIPNNANSITINKVFLTSATGANTTTASYTLTSPVTLKSGQSATILIPNVACNSANIHYSLSAKIQYSYTASTLGLQNVNTTGTVAGTSITGKPSTLTSYEPITITNTQGSATPNPFQQMINFTSSDPGFSSIATGNFGQNVEFFYYNGTIIPSWLENYTSTNATWWVKIATIPGGSSETVYIGFAPKATNLFNTVNDGEAPQIPCGSTPTSSCSNYAEYDDGDSVFNFYSDFKGTSLNLSKWNYLSSATFTVDNSFLIYNSFNYNSFVLSSKQYFDNLSIFGTYSQFYTNETSCPYLLWDNGPNNYKVIRIGGSDCYVHYAGYPDSHFNTPYNAHLSSEPELFYIIPKNFTYLEGFYNNIYLGTFYYNDPSGNPSFNVDLVFGNGVDPAQFVKTYYVFVGSPIPNGVMPFVSFGSVA